MKSRAPKMLLAAALAAAPVSAMSVPANSESDYGRPASIPFASHGGIRNWRAFSDDELFIQDQRGRWYLATLAGPCSDMRWATAIGFETGPTGHFDNWSSIRTRDGRCRVMSFVTSPAPPKRKPKRRG